MKTEGRPRPDDENLSDAEMAKRIDFARLGLYRQIGRTASEQNLYFESVMNLFIAVVQVPLSFAVLRREGGVLKPAFHMCTDKQHQRWFEGVLGSKVFDAAENCFPLFPDVLDGEYCISVWLMHTKTPLRGDRTTLVPFPRASDWKSVAAEKDPRPFEYVADCAKRFFSDPWDGFGTDFAPFIKSALKESLRKLEWNHVWVATSADDRSRGANWPPDYAFQIKAQEAVKHPNSDKDDWHHHLSKTLEPTIKALKFGTNAVSSLLWNSGESTRLSHETGTTSSESGSNFNLSSGPSDASDVADVEIDNLLIMYRSFDRRPDANDKGRHATSEGAYPYNVRILLPRPDQAQQSKPLEFFRWLKSVEPSRGPEDAVGGKDWLYSSLVGYPNSITPTHEDEVRFALMSVLDEWFWFTLRKSEGPQQLVELLSSAVGNESRSLADPVFNTGLIHYNPIFEFGGLDRVQLEKFPAEIVNAALEYRSGRLNDSARSIALASMIDELDRCIGVCKDMRRIVTFFYFASAMVKGGTNRNTAISGKYTGKSLAAVLMPIKIRGSVWAVSLHVTLMDPLGPRHLQTWMSNFFLMTNQLEIMNFMIDRALWDNLERRISGVLAREVGRGATPQEGGFERLEASMLRVNEKLAGELRLVPFVLPEFRLNWKAANRAKVNSIRLFPKPRDGEDVGDESGLDLVLDVEWDIEPNSFFVSRQPWTGTTSRSLEPAIRLGLEHGLRELAVLRKEFLLNGHLGRLS